MGKSTNKEIKLSKLIAPYYINWWKKEQNYIFKTLKGGRNSAKSSHVALKIIYLMMKYPVNALAVRKIANTLHDSVFQQLKWAIEYLGVDMYWQDFKSPLRLVYKPTGQEILFKGANEPQRIKSIKTYKFPLSILWIEELAEFKTEEEMKTIVDSIIRSELNHGLKYNIYLTYNPPKLRTSWVNKTYNTQFISKNTYVHHSSYLNNPYVSSSFIDEAETVKINNLNRYEWLYLGKAIGGGLIPFSNLVFRRITDEEISTFDNIRQGLDFGYTAPTHFTRSHFNEKKENLYILNEFRGRKLKNKKIVEWVFKNKFNDAVIYADSEDPRSINEIKSYGVKIRPAKKGPGSIEYGLEWLDTLNEIIIDCERTPHLAKEFENADFKLDKDGQTLPDLDGEDHAIDSCRYMMEHDMKRNNYKY